MTQTTIEHKTNGGLVSASTMESLIISGDLGKLTPSDRVIYYGQVCESLKLNPLTKPFQYINLNGKLTLYATKDATEQLRRIYSISLTIVKREISTETGLCVIDVEATLGSRKDFGTGAVSITGLKGESLANAVMKAETKAKRRATLSIVGLGWTDESEVDSIPGSEYVDVTDDGVIDDKVAKNTLDSVMSLKEKMRMELKNESEEYEKIKAGINDLLDGGHIANDKAVATRGWMTKDHSIEKWRELHKNLLDESKEGGAKNEKG